MMKRHRRSSIHSGKASKAGNLEASTPERQLGKSSAASSAHNETTGPNDGENNSSQLLDHTPEMRKHQSSRHTHVDSHQTRDCVVGRGEIAPVDDFHNQYLRKCKDCRKNKSDEHWNKFKQDLSECKLESDMHSIIVKFLTEMCIAVCKPRTLLFATDTACSLTLFCRKKHR